LIAAALKPRSRMASLALFGANLAILFIAAFRKWGCEYLLAVMWWEAVIIGFFNLCRIFVVGLKAEGLGKNIGFANLESRLFFTFWVSTLFVVKFGGFVLGVGFLVLLAPVLAVGNGENEFSAMAEAAQAIGGSLVPVIGLLFVSHGVSFVQNFLGRGEYRWSGLMKLLFWPYARLAILMLVIFGGFLAAQMFPDLGRTRIFTMAVILAKLAVDWGTHRFEHG